MNTELDVYPSVQRYTIKGVTPTEQHLENNDSSSDDETQIRERTEVARQIEHHDMEEHGDSQYTPHLWVKNDTSRNARTMDRAVTYYKCSGILTSLFFVLFNLLLLGFVSAALGINSVWIDLNHYDVIRMRAILAVALVFVVLAIDVYYGILFGRLVDFLMRCCSPYSLTGHSIIETNSADPVVFYERSVRNGRSLCASTALYVMISTLVVAALVMSCLSPYFLLERENECRATNATEAHTQDTTLPPLIRKIAGENAGLVVLLEEFLKPKFISVPMFCVDSEDGPKCPQVHVDFGTLFLNDTSPVYQIMHYIDDMDYRRVRTIATRTLLALSFVASILLAAFLMVSYSRNVSLIVAFATHPNIEIIDSRGSLIPRAKNYSMLEEEEEEEV